MDLTSTARHIIMVIGAIGWISFGLVLIGALGITVFWFVDRIAEDLGWWTAVAFMAFLFMMPFMMAALEMSATHCAQEQIRRQNRDL